MFKITDPHDNGPVTWIDIATFIAVFVGIVLLALHNKQI